MSSCASCQNAASFPQVHSAMDTTQDNNFKLPEEKEDFNDKTAKIILPVILVGACVAAAIFVPLVVANKF